MGIIVMLMSIELAWCNKVTNKDHIIVFCLFLHAIFLHKNGAGERETQHILFEKFRREKLPSPPFSGIKTSVSLLVCWEGQDIHSQVVVNLI